MTTVGGGRPHAKWWTQVAVGPDAQRYLLAANGIRVARPFNMRALLPAICGDDLRLWWATWAISWPTLALGTLAWTLPLTPLWSQRAAITVLVVALWGVWGPKVVRPVGVDLPAMAMTMLAAAAWVNDYHALAWIVLVWAAATKETQPIWLALWVWSPWPLLALVIPAGLYLYRRPAMDPVTARNKLRHVHDHPVQSAIAARAGRWRDAWLWVAPWGACLAALWAPTWQWAATMTAAHAQMLVATDTVRLLHTAAGPVAALVAVQAMPTEWLAPAVALASVFWWRTPEVV